MQSVIYSISERRHACPDCPAFHVGVPAELLPASGQGCGFECIRVDARAPMPDRFHEQAAFALVRRGIIVRQRVDARGRAVTIDAAGTGGIVPIDPERCVRVWAVTDVVLCLLPARGAEIWCAGSGNTVASAMRMILDRVERIAEARGRIDAQGRTASLVCVLADALGPVPRPFVPSDLPQRTMAALAAIRHESMCRALQGLLERKVVARTEQGLTIVDRAALEAI